MLKTRGHEVVLISRSPAMKSTEHKEMDRITWAEIKQDGLPNDTHAVINLAGELLMNPLRRWDSSFKKDLWDSRINTNTTLVNAIKAAEQKPEVFISSSAVGYYPPSTTAEYTEDSVGGEGNDLADLCKDWEASAQLPTDSPTRLVTVRIGLVLGREGGVIRNMILPFWLGVGGRIASGEQWFPWVHVEDVAGIITHAVENPHVKGVLNATAPDYITNSQFTKSFGGAMWRPTIFPVPGFVINLVFGKERGQAMIEGQKVIPQRTLESGYEFVYPDIDSASKEFSRLLFKPENYTM